MNVSPLFLAGLSIILKNCTLGGNIHYPKIVCKGETTCRMHRATMECSKRDEFYFEYKILFSAVNNRFLSSI